MNNNPSLHEGAPDQAEVQGAALPEVDSGNDDDVADQIEAKLKHLHDEYGQLDSNEAELSKMLEQCRRDEEQLVNALKQGQVKIIPKKKRINHLEKEARARLEKALMENLSSSSSSEDDEDPQP